MTAINFDEAFTFRRTLEKVGEGLGVGASKIDKTGPVFW